MREDMLRHRPGPIGRQGLHALGQRRDDVAVPPRVLPLLGLLLRLHDGSDFLQHLGDDPARRCALLIRTRRTLLPDGPAEHDIVFRLLHPVRDVGPGVLEDHLTDHRIAGEKSHTLLFGLVVIVRRT